MMSVKADGIDEGGNNSRNECSVMTTKMPTTKVERLKVAKMTGAMTKVAHGKNNGLVKYP